MNKTTLYVFGDSFTTPNFCVQPQDSYWGLLSKDLAVTSIINYSHSGFSFDQIIHLLCNESLNFENAYFFIGVPPIERLAVTDITKRWTKAEFDKNFIMEKTDVPVIANTQHYDFLEAFIDAKFFLANYTFKWQQQIICDKIYMMYHWLKNMNTKFVIINLTAPFYSHNTLIEDKLKQLKDCILFDNTCHSINEADGIKPADWDNGTGWYGHHGSEGNANWYNKILRPKAMELGWL